MFILGHTPSFFVLLCLASFFRFSGTRPNPFPVLTRTFSDTCPNFTLFRYLPGFYLFGTRPDFTLLQYSPGFHFFGTHPDSFPVLIRILPLSRYLPGPFSSTHSDSFPVLTRILPFSRYLPGPFSSTHPNSTPFLVLVWTLLRYSPRAFFGTHSDTVLSVLDSPVLTWIRSPICLVFFDTRSDTISYPVSFLDFLIFSSIASGFL